MNQEEKREYKALKRKLFGLNTISLIMVNILTFVFVNTIIICLQKFISLNSTITFLILMGTCVIASIIFIISKIVKSHRKKRTKLSFWFTNNFPKLLLYYTILLFLFLSISNTPIWDINEVHEVLSIEWTIFGLSIAIFLVWDVIYINYLKKKQPYATDKYYLMPEKNDSFAFVTPYFAKITEEQLAGVGEDGNPIRDIILNNTVYDAVNSMFAEKDPIFSFDLAYVTEGVIELMDINEDGTNDYGHSMWIEYNEEDQENFTVAIEFTSYIYKFEGDTTYYSIIEVAFENYEEM